MRAPQPPRIRREDGQPEAPVEVRPEPPTTEPRVPARRAPAAPIVLAAEPVSMTPRIEERQRAESRARLIRLGIVVVSVLAIAVLAWGAFFSPLFALRADEISLETHGEGIDTAAVQEIVSQFDGVPLTRLRMSSIEEPIQEITVVLTAEAARDWPHGLSLVVTAREPVAAVPSDSGYRLFDTEGVALHSVEEAPEGIPVIETDVDDDTGRTVNAILKVLGEIPDDLRSDIVTISATTEQTIAFVLGDGATVKWGDSTENELKAAALLALRQIDARTYDVSVPRNPVTS